MWVGGSGGVCVWGGSPYLREGTNPPDGRLHGQYYKSNPLSLYMNKI